MNIKVGNEYRFKDGLGLNHDADGKKFIIIRMDQNYVWIKLIYDSPYLEDNTEYHLEKHLWDTVVSPATNKWQGSHLIFNFI